VFAKLLGVRPEDRRDTGVAFFTLAAILTGHSMLETARDAMFLEKLPPEQLPIAYIAIALFALLVTKLNTGAAQRFSRRKLLSISLMIGGAVTALFYQLTASTDALMLGALYVWTGVLATAVVVQFWLQLGDVLDVTQAKRVFSIIAAGGLVGATVGSALAGALLTVFHQPRLLLLVSAGFFVVASAVPMGFRGMPEVEQPTRRTPKQPPPKRGSNLKLVVKDPYLIRLFSMVLVGAVLVTGIDFLFKARVVAYTELHDWDLGTFFAGYYALVNAVSLLVQLVLAPRLLRAVGVNRAMYLMPALLLCGAIGFALTLALVPALILKGVDGSLRHSVHRTASEILYLPLQRKVRERFKGFAAAVGQRGGQALASLLILGVTSFSPHPRHFALGLCVLALLWFATMVGLQPHYMNLFRKQLRDGALDTEVDVPALDLASFELLVSALSAEDDTEVIAALEMFDAYGKTELVPALILYHPSREVVLRAFELFAKSKRADVRRLAVRLLRHEDTEIQAAALRTVATLDDNETMLRAFVDDDSAALRCTALVGLIVQGHCDEAEARAELHAIVDGDSPEMRLALARTVSGLPADRFDWVAADLAGIDEPNLAAALATSLADAPDERYLQVLLPMLAARDTRTEARRALVAIGDPALERLAKALRDDSIPRAVQTHIPRTISRFPSARAAEILLDALLVERNDVVFFKTLRGLGRMRSERSDVAVNRPRLLDLAQRLLKEAVTALHWRLGVGKVVARQQQAMTRASELLIAFLSEKEARALQRVFRLLHIIEPTQEFRIIYDGLKSENKKAKASSRELLSLVVPQPLRDGILNMVDDVTPRQRLKSATAFFDPPGRTELNDIMAALRKDEDDADALQSLGVAYADMLRDMLADPSQALRAIVRHHIKELGFDELRAEVANAAKKSDDVLGELATDSVINPSTMPKAIGPMNLDPELSGAG
jgi:AAA family ATP:ADP antiporter